MDLIYKQYKVFLISDLPDDIKQYFINYVDNSRKNTALFFTVGKVKNDKILVYGDYLTKDDYLYNLHSYFKKLENETILIYFNQ